MIPYILFFLILGIGIIIGILKGWKASLYFSIMQIVSIGILVGIYFAASEKIINLAMPILRPKMVSGLDYSEIIDLMKVPIGATFVSILLLPSNLLALLLYWAIKIPLNKYLNPEITELSSNSRQVIVKKKWKIRLVGGITGSISSLMVGSIIASAATFGFVKTNKQNWFTKTTDSISGISTFGQFRNTESFKFIYDYMPILQNQAFANNLKKLFSVTDKNNNNAFLLNPKMLSEIRNVNNTKSELTRRVFSNPKATTALITTVLSGVNPNTEVIEDNVAKGNKGDRTIQALTNLLRKKTSLGFGITNNVVKDIIKSKFASKIQTFESTTWYKDWKNAQQVVRHAREVLSKTQQKLNNTVNNLRLLISERNKLIDIMIQDENSQQNLTNIVIPQKTREIDLAWTNNLTTKRHLDDAKTRESNWRNNEFNPSERKWNLLVIDVKQKQQILDSTNNALISTKGDLSSAKNKKSNSENRISNLNNDATNLQQKLITKQHELQTLQNKELTQRSDLQPLRSQLSSVTQSIQTKTANIISLNQQLKTMSNNDPQRQQLINNINNEKTQLSNLSSQKNDLSGQVSNKQRELDSTSNQINRAQLEIANLNNQITNNQQELIQANNDLSTATRNISTYTRNIQILENAKIQHQYDLNQTEQAKNNARPDHDYKTSEMRRLEKVSSDKLIKWTNANNWWNKKKQELIQLVYQRDELIRKRDMAKKQFDNSNKNQIGDLVQNYNQVSDPSLTWMHNKKLRDIDLNTFREISPVGFGSFTGNSRNSIRSLEVERDSRQQELNQKIKEKNVAEKIKDTRQQNYNNNKKELLNLLIKLLED